MINLFLFVASAFAASTFENCRLTVDLLRGNTVTESHAANLQKIGDEDGIVTYRTFVAGRYAYLVHASGSPIGDLSRAPIARDVTRRTFLPGSFFLAGIFDSRGDGRTADLKPEYTRYQQFLNERPASDEAMYRFVREDGKLAEWRETLPLRRASLDSGTSEGRNATLVCD